MDLVSFIPGIGPTKQFTAGVNTPAAYLGPHTGLTDGTTPATASNNMAEIYNRLLLQVASTIKAAGLTVDNTNWAQLATAVQAIANSSVNSALPNYLTKTEAEATYATWAGVFSLLHLSEGTVFAVGNSVNSNGVSVPASGYWAGIWMSGGAWNAPTNLGVFSQAGGTILGAGANNVQAFGVRYL